MANEPQAAHDRLQALMDQTMTNHPRRMNIRTLYEKDPASTTMILTGIGLLIMAITSCALQLAVLGFQYQIQPSDVLVALVGFVLTIGGILSITVTDLRDARQRLAELETLLRHP
jgi:hypothetical protein